MVYFIEMKRTIHGESAMKELGEAIGRSIRGGEFIELIGDVGAGKTTLTKGIATGLGITDVVQSPTFTINRTYDSPLGVRLLHYDFYRLSEPGIMADELSEALESGDQALVVEWGDIIADIVPADRLRITITSPGVDIREVTLDAAGVKSQRLLKEVTE